LSTAPKEEKTKEEQEDEENEEKEEVTMRRKHIITYLLHVAESFLRS